MSQPSPMALSLDKMRADGYLPNQYGRFTFNGAQWMLGQCKFCLSEFVKPARGKPYEFCSRFCAMRDRHGPVNEIECKCCKKKFVAKRGNGRIYCSVSCSIKSLDNRGEKNPNFKNAGAKVCEACGVHFYSLAKGRRFCGMNCVEATFKEEGMASQRRGYEAEIKCMHALMRDGFLANRSAASRGPFDVFAIGRRGVYLIQVKRTKHLYNRRQVKAVEELKKIECPETAHKQVWCWVDRTGWYVTHIFNDGSSKEFWMTDDKDYQQFANVTGVYAEELALDANM